MDPANGLVKKVLENSTENKTGNIATNNSSSTQDEKNESYGN